METTRNGYRFIKDKKRMMFFSMTFYADYYDSDGDGVPSVEDHFKEVETIIEDGYIDSLYIHHVKEEDPDTIKRLRGVLKLCLKHNITCWLYCHPFHSNEEPIEDYFARVERTVEEIKSIDGAWDIFSGFYWDEPFLNKQTNQDFHDITKGLYEKYGKRLYTCFSSNMLCRGIADVCNIPKEREIPEPWAVKYLTDAGWDNYAYDIRESVKGNKGQAERLNQLSEGAGETFVTADDFYQFVQRKLVELFDHPINMWMYPCAYNAGSYSYLPVNEDYCVSQVDYFEKFLDETSEKYAHQTTAGMCMFTYNSRIFIGLVKHLPIKIDGKMLCTEEGFEEKWYEMEKAIKRVKNAYDDEGEIELYAGFEM